MKITYYQRALSLLSCALSSAFQLPDQGMDNVTEGASSGRGSWVDLTESHPFKVLGLTPLPQSSPTLCDPLTIMTYVLMSSARNSRTISFCSIFCTFTTMGGGIILELRVDLKQQPQPMGSRETQVHLLPIGPSTHG